MTARTLIALFTACAVASAQGFSVEAEHNTVLYPDGSGTFTMKITVTKDAKVPDNVKNVLEGKADPDQIARGMVAWTEPKVEKNADRQQVTVVGYFEDINKVNANGLARFEFTKNDTGFALARHDDTLDVFTNLPKKIATLDEKNKNAAKQIMLKGFSYTANVTVFGTISEAKGFMDKDARKASIKVDASLIIDVFDGKEEAVKKIESISGDAKITWAKNEVSDADAAAFKKELEAAKESWKKIREEMKKKASDK